MEIKQRDHGGIAILDLSGRLDLSSGTILKEK